MAKIHPRRRPRLLRPSSSSPTPMDRRNLDSPAPSPLQATHHHLADSSILPRAASNRSNPAGRLPPTPERSPEPRPHRQTPHRQLPLGLRQTRRFLEG